MKFALIIALVFAFMISSCLSDNTKNLCKRCEIKMDALKAQLKRKSQSIIEGVLKKDICGKNMPPYTAPFCNNMSTIMKELQHGATAKDVCKKYKYCPEF
ncbi:hypothetical protein OSTOST_16174 [Ostertagia ostertagi]